jgi:pimeloyl-ACP methyl ester carboxylesterase
MRVVSPGFLSRFVVGLAALAATGCADSILLHPTHEPWGRSPAARRVVGFEGGELELWTIRTAAVVRETPEFFVLSFIGNADRAERWAVAEMQSWRDRPAEIWAVNYPGYGGSTGPAGLDRLPVSALAAFDELQKVAAGRPILVSGNSLGTTAALYVAANRPVDGVVLRNPPPLRRLILCRYGWWNLWIAAGIVALQVPSDLDSLDNGPKVRAPAVFILSTDDEVVPPSYQQDVVDAYGGEKTIVPLQGDHNSSLAPRDALDAALKRLESDARNRRSRPVEK